MFNDVSRAYFYAKCTRDPYVELPVEDPKAHADFIGKLRLWHEGRHVELAGNVLGAPHRPGVHPRCGPPIGVPSFSQEHMDVGPWRR